MPHCEDVGCLIRVVDGRESCQRTLHAEQNAVIQAATTGCRARLRPLLHPPAVPVVREDDHERRIEEVRYTGGYPDPLAVELAAEGGLGMVQLASDNG
jgi:dCMP deaminase